MIFETISQRIRRVYNLRSYVWGLRWGLPDFLHDIELCPPSAAKSSSELTKTLTKGLYSRYKKDFLYRVWLDHFKEHQEQGLRRPMLLVDGLKNFLLDVESLSSVMHKNAGVQSFEREAIELYRNLINK